VHYPGDVVIKAVIGTAVGEAVGGERGDWRDAVDDPRGEPPPAGE
jgi:phage tail tape-measure protein